MDNQAWEEDYVTYVSGYTVYTLVSFFFFEKGYHKGMTYPQMILFTAH